MTDAKDTASQKHLGHYYWVELYLLHDTYTAEAWNGILQTICRKAGWLRRWSLYIHNDRGTMRYFIGSDRDISMLSNNLAGVLVYATSYRAVSPPRVVRKEHMTRLASAENLLDFAEHYQTARAKTLAWTSFRMRMLNNERVVCEAKFCFRDQAGSYTLARKFLRVLPGYLLAIDFSKNTKYLHKKPPAYLDIEKTAHIMRSDRGGALFAADTFPYLPGSYYLNLDSYDFDKHSFIVGASGSGKSKFIGLFINTLMNTPHYRRNYRVIIIDPHDSLHHDIGGDMARVIRFQGNDDAAELFANVGTDISAATELTGTLFKSLLADQHNPKLERVMRFSLYVLMTAQVMNLDTLKRFLTDIDYRHQVLHHVEAYIPANIGKFFGTDFNDMRTKYYNEAIAPIVSLVEEMQIQPSIGRQGSDAVSLSHLIQAQPVTLFSLNKISMGEKVVKTVAGLIIQQIFLLAQARSFREKIILIIDEVSVVQTPALAQILAEARKYNLFVFLAQQYFGQIDPVLRDAVFANVVNYYVFRVSEDDARSLEGNLTIEFPKNLLATAQASGKTGRDLRVEILTSLHQRECMLRLMNDGQILPCIKARTMDFVADPAQAAVHMRPYTQASLPSKFQESVMAANRFSDTHDSTKVATARSSMSKTPSTLADFLRLQSSSPDKQKKE